jgi:hypothetical protein
MSRAVNFKEGNEGLIQAWPATRPMRLRNVVCPYCGEPLTTANSTKEHVVGRRFVPKGRLQNSWNLILNACRGCNNGKSDLEDDISAITMQPDVLGRYFGDHTQLALDAAHKAQRTRSRSTGKLVGESRTAMAIKHEFAGMTMTFNLVGQQHIEGERAFELALRHFQAFFYLITYDQSENRGWWWIGNYAPLQAASRNDWGNDFARGFMSATRDWETRVLAITAEEHFKLAIRRHPSQEMWSLATEWNENYRVIAVCGKAEAITAFVAALPKLKMRRTPLGPESYYAARTEVALKPEHDIMFVPVGEVAPASIA